MHHQPSHPLIHRPDPDTLRVDAPAKVNLALAVAPPLPPTHPRAAMHPIASWMVCVDLCDRLTLRRRSTHHEPRPSLLIRFDDADDSPAAGLQVDWPIEKDLAFRAMRLLSDRIGQAPAVDVTLSKRIPTGAGLGGGSSDAAAVLVGLDRLLELRLPTDELAELGAGLGSDVPFLVRALADDATSALVTGLGERIEPVASPRPSHLVLIFPGPELACPTAEVYRQFDRSLTDRPDILGRSEQTMIDRVRTLALGGDPTPDDPFNDLSEPACAVRPMLGELRLQIGRTVGLPVHVSGSGSTLYFLARNRDEACRHTLLVKRSFGLRAMPVSTLVPATT